MRILNLFFIAFLSGCALNKYKDMKKPEVKLETVNVQDATMKGAKILFGIKVANPNSFPLRVDSVKYDIEIGGKQMSTESIDTPTEVAANATQIVQLPLTVQFADIFEGIGAFLRNDMTSYRVKGAARIGLFSLPFDESGEFRIRDGEIQHQKK